MSLPVTEKTHSPIRIAWYVHPLRLGGLEYFLLRLAERLDPAVVRIIAMFASKGEVADTFAERGIETQVLGFRSFRHGFETLAGALVSQRIDIVQTNMFTPLAAIAAGHAGVPHIWRVGGHPDVALRRMSPKERRGQLEIMALQSAAIICNSHFVSEPFAGLPGPRPVVIRNGIALVPSDQPPHNAMPDTSKPPRICMLAHFDPQKRHEDLIRAAALLKDQLPLARFYLFGSTFGEQSMVAYRRELRALIKSLGLAGVVIMRRTRDARSELLRATLSVMPSIDESSSNAILESMSSQTPVVAADSGGNREMITSNLDGLLIKPRSPELLAEAILKLVQNPLLSQEIARKAYKRLGADYDIDQCARRHQEFYRDCIAANSKGLAGRSGCAA